MTGKTSSDMALPEIPRHSVTVAGTRYDLVVTIDAVLAIGQTCGGLAAAFRRIGDMDLEAMSSVILSGSGTTFKTAAEVRAFTEGLWREGVRLGEIGGALRNYLAVLLVGGVTTGDDPGDGSTEGNG